MSSASDLHVQYCWKIQVSNCRIFVSIKLTLLNLSHNWPCQWNTGQQLSAVSSSPWISSPLCTGPESCPHIYEVFLQSHTSASLSLPKHLNTLYINHTEIMSAISFSYNWKHVHQQCISAIKQTLYFLPSVLKLHLTWHTWCFPEYFRSSMQAMRPTLQQND